MQDVRTRQRGRCRSWFAKSLPVGTASNVHTPGLMLFAEIKLRAIAAAGALPRDLW